MNNRYFDSYNYKNIRFSDSDNNIVNHPFYVNQINLHQLSKDILILINYIRTNTSDYIRNLLQKYTLNNTYIQEILSDISKINTPLFPYNLINEISLAAKDQLDYIIQFPNNNHETNDINLNLRTRLTKYGLRTGRIFESVITKKNSAEEIVFQIIKTQKGRNMIFNSKMRFIGIACGTLSNYIISVIDIVQDFKPYKNKNSKLSPINPYKNITEYNSDNSFFAQKYKNIRLNSVEDLININDINSIYEKTENNINSRNKNDNSNNLTNRSFYSGNFSATRVPKENTYVKKNVFYANKHINNSKSRQKYDDKKYDSYNGNKFITEDYNTQRFDSDTKVTNRNLYSNSILNTLSSFETNNLKSRTNNFYYSNYNGYNTDFKINRFRKKITKEEKIQLLKQINDKNKKIKKTISSSLDLSNINNINNDIIKLEIKQCRNNLFKKTSLSPSNLKIKINEPQIYGNNRNLSRVNTQTDYNQNSEKKDNIYLNFFNNLYIQPRIKNNISEKITEKYNTTTTNDNNKNNINEINKNTFSCISLSKKFNYKNKKEVKKLIKLYNQVKECQRNIENYVYLSQNLNQKFDQTTTPYINYISRRKENLNTKPNKNRTNNENCLKKISSDQNEFNTNKNFLKPESKIRNIYIPLKVKGCVYKISRSSNSFGQDKNNSDINFFNKSLIKNGSNEKIDLPRNILCRENKHNRDKLKNREKLKEKEFVKNKGIKIINVNKKIYYD